MTLLPAPPGLAADMIDPSTGELLSLTQGLHPVDAAIITALRTTRGTGTAVQSAGQRYRDVQRAGSGAADVLAQETRFALSALVEARQLRIDLLTVEIEGTAGVIEVRYFNLVERTERVLRATVPEVLR